MQTGYGLINFTIAIEINNLNNTHIILAFTTKVAEHFNNTDISID